MSERDHASRAHRASRYAFQDFVLDADTETLCRTGRLIKLRPQSFAVLRYLIERHNRLVSKRELHRNIWGDAVVTDNSLRQCLIEIRKALGDEAKQMIRTVPRRGFIVDMPVRRSGPDSKTAGSSLPATRDGGNLPLAGRRSPGLAIAGVAVVAFAVVAFILLQGSQPEPIVAPARPTAAVSVVPDRVTIDRLRISGTIGDSDAVARLAASSFSVALGEYGLTSVPWDSEMDGPISELALESSLFRSQAGYLIDVRLSEAATGTSVWTKRYEGSSVEDVLQQSATQTAYVVECGRFRRSLIPRKISAELFGMWISACDLNVNQRRVEFYEQVLEIARVAPNDAASHAGLANSILRMLAVTGPMSPRSDLLSDARASANASLALEPEFAEALLVLADLEPFVNWQEREQYILRAFRSDPHFKWTRSQYFMFLHRVGRLREATHFAERTTSHARGPNHLSHRAWLLTHTGRVSEGIAMLEDVEDHWPRDVLGVRKRFFVHAFFADPSIAEQMLSSEKLLRTIESRGSLACWTMLLEHRLHGTRFAATTLRDECPSDENTLLPRVLAVMGNIDGAFAELHALADDWDARGHADVPMNLFGPEMARLREDVRFMQLAERFGLSTYWSGTGRLPDFCARETLPYDCEVAAREASQSGVRIAAR